MTNPFYERPILNSPYEYPEHHWELDEFGQLGQRVPSLTSDAAVSLITPVPKHSSDERTRSRES